MLADAGTATLAVFSHPNHELAIFGLLQSCRPVLIYLTDGGGEDRVAQTREGLQSIGLLSQAHFLDHTEQSFYDALMARDVTFYEEVAGQLRALCETIRPARVLCDAVEFYNPVHDMALPIVRAALRESVTAAIFEVPLVYQKAADADACEIQRVRPSRRTEQIARQLSQQELAMKARARDQIYTSLAAQMGPWILNIPLTHLGLEVIVPARTRVPAPGGDEVLRYEHRADILLAAGRIEQKITYHQHYRPIAASLFGHA